MQHKRLGCHCPDNNSLLKKYAALLIYINISK